MAAARPPRLIASLKLPRAKAHEVIVIANGIVEAMTHNTWFPSPTPTLASAKTAIGKLQSAQVATLTRAVGTTTVRDIERAALVRLLHQLKGYVQSIADANPEEAASIITGSGMSLKKHPVMPAREFAAKQGPVSGSVKLVAPRAAQRAGYEWGMSTDGGKTWPSLPFTLQAKTVVEGLVPGSTVMFRYRPTTKGGGGNWSQTISFIVR